MVDKSSLAKRIWSSFLILSLSGLIVFIFPNWVFSLFAASIVGVGLAEFFGIAERKGIFVYKYFGVIIGMLVPVITYLQMGTEGYFTSEPIIIMIACLFLFVLQFTRRDTSQAITSISVTMFGLLYIAWLFSFFIKLKYLPDGALLVTFIILVTKIGDVGAYFIGGAMGKRALIPRISPNKTVEGTIGGLVLSLIVALLSKFYLPKFPIGHLFVLGILLGILGQVGDLAESVLKRDSGVKDSGANMPGFGGVLDMIDSLLFTVPIFYFYVVVLMK
jgi:phosphatidate cytidylyltransferase